MKTMMTDKSDDNSNENYQQGKKSVFQQTDGLLSNQNQQWRQPQRGRESQSDDNGDEVDGDDEDDDEEEDDDDEDDYDGQQQRQLSRE